MEKGQEVSMSEGMGSGILWTLISQTGDWRCSSVYMIVQWHLYNAWVGLSYRIN